MNKFIQNLRKNDFFSVTYFPAISDGFNFNHSSVLGGMISIFIAILSLMYGWTYQLLPKVTSDLNQFSEKDNFGQLKNFINIKPPYQQGWSPIDPFKRDEIILQPLIQMILNSNVNDVLNINLHMNYTKQYYIIFTLCKEDYLLDQQKCASEETKNLYLKQHGNSLYIEIQFTTIKPSKFEPQIFERTYQIHIHSQAEMYSSIILHYQMNHYLIDRAFLFSTTGQEEHNFIYQIHQIIHNIPQKIIVITFFVLFQQQYYTVQIVYPPISEVFAAIGSIISILFSVKFIITILNLQQLKQDVLDDIMTQYYPEIKQFQIIKNWFGKIIQVKFKGLQVDISNSFSNGIFQFILLSIKIRTEIERVLNSGIKVPIQLSESGDSYTITQGQVNQLKTINLRNNNQSEYKYDILTINDALILSYDYKNFEQNILSSTKRTENENNQIEQDFFDINQIEPQYNQNEEI